MKYIIGKWMDFFFRVRVRTADMNTITDTIVLCCNHVNLLDTFVVQKLCLDMFPDHHVAFVHGDSARQVPLLQRFLSRYHVYIEDLKTGVLPPALRSVSRKILVLFPEGRLFCETNRMKSRGFCEAQGIPAFEHVLCPYEKGFSILRTVLDDSCSDVMYLDATIVYPWYHENDYRFMTIMDTIRHSWPREDAHVDVHVKSFDAPPLLTVWREKDELFRRVRQG